MLVEETCEHCVDDSLSNIFEHQAGSSHTIPLLSEVDEKFRNEATSVTWSSSRVLIGEFACANIKRKRSLK